MESRDNNTMSILCNTSNCHFNTINEVVPSPFNEMTIYQLCSWWGTNPNALQLANNMNFLVQTPDVDGPQFFSISSSVLTTPQNQENKMKNCHDLLEELKYLFLRVCNLPKSVLEELIHKVIKCELNLTEGIE